MNSRRLLLIGAGLLACVAVMIVAFSAGGPQEKKALPEPGTTKGGAAESGALANGSGSGGSQGGKAGSANSAGAGTGAVATVHAPLPADAPVERVLAVIEEASISYDPKELPRIQPFLLHPDPEVRAAALNGILVLGDAAGAPLLRAAAKQTAVPQEAVKLLETADYLELPSASLLPPGKKGLARPAGAIKRLPPDQRIQQRRAAPPETAAPAPATEVPANGAAPNP
jgi:hypothetical protein